VQGAGFWVLGSGYRVQDAYLAGEEPFAVGVEVEAQEPDGCLQHLPWERVLREG